LATAERLIRRRTDIVLPRGQLCTDRQDVRPLSYGIDSPIKLFSDRQLVVLGTAMSWLRNAELSPGARRAVTLALSNTLTTNNKLCGYATDYGRLAPLFSVRGYPLPALPVELNPLHGEGGRGTIAQCLERVAHSADSTVRRHSWSARAKGPEPVQMTFSRPQKPARVICASASAEVGEDDEVDLCVFDPPYFDYIAYSELSEFYRCWLETHEASGTPLLPHGDDPAERFGLDLATCLRTSLSQLAPRRPLAFTYHSANTEAWRAIGIAMDDAKLAVTALWPVRSDGHMGHHSHPGNCEWDLVIVCRRLVETRPAKLRTQVQDWVVAVKPLSIGEADRTSMALAIATAAPRFAEPECTSLTEGAES
jgi:adenine-specific DNA methylase